MLTSSCGKYSFPESPAKDEHEVMGLELMFDTVQRISLLNFNDWTGQSLAGELLVHHQANRLAREARGCRAFIS